jgi:hypothetical protein
MTVSTHEPGWYPDPWGAPGGAPANRWWDGREWTGASLPRPSFKNAGVLVPYLVAALLACAVTEVLAVAADLARMAWIADARAGSGPGLLEAARRSDGAVALANGVGLLALIGCAVLWLVWFPRLYHDTGLFQRARFPKWAVWGWFTPFFSLVRPKQMVNDAWAAGDPAQDRTEVPRVSPLVHLWWATWLVSKIVGITGVRLYDSGLDRDARLASLRLATQVSIVSEVLSLVAALLAVYVVVVTTRRIEARGRAAGYLAKPH